jgi:copper chaperone NosL
MLIRFCIIIVFFIFSACSDEEHLSVPYPKQITADANGYYCGMTVKNHKGPKAQIHLKGSEEPLWFVSVRDAIAFTLLPEEPKNIASIYVTDMSIDNWEHPELELKSWIDANQAFYVINSNKNGGMGAAEAIPFLHRQDADEFSKMNEGQVIALADIPTDYILGSSSEH